MSRVHLICVDGTGCHAESQTAVSRIARAVQRRGDLRITVRYLRGQGSRWYSHVRGGIGGLEITRQVRKLWAWLANTAKPGDVIVFIGFSRGGSAVLSLANLIDRCGLVETHLFSDAHDLAKTAWKAASAREGYRNWRCASFAQREGHWRPRIAFLGVFDAVGALGVGLPRPVARALVGAHELDLPDCVDAAAQALAADEERFAFQPAVWTAPADGRRIAQAWFSGVHGEIGGSAADASARWLVACARDVGVPLPDPLPPIGREPSALAALLRKRPRTIGKAMLTGECLHESHPLAAEGELYVGFREKAGLQIVSESEPWPA